MSVKRRLKNRDIKRTLSLVEPSNRRVLRRNTTIPEASPQACALLPDTPPYSPAPVDQPDFGGQRFNFFHKRRASVPAYMLSGRPGSTKSSLGFSSGSLNKAGSGGRGTPNGHISPQRFRHFSTGSSIHSDDPEASISDTAASSTNFFDFDENSDDIYLVQPEEHVNNMRKEQKKKGR